MDRFGPWIIKDGELWWGLLTAALPPATLTLRHAVPVWFRPQQVDSCDLPIGLTLLSWPGGGAVAFSGNHVGPAIGGTVSTYLMARLGGQWCFISSAA